jgi:uncharacterized membrane-anchored protein YitT (DUF2179 family)
LKTHSNKGIMNQFKNFKVKKLLQELYNYLLITLGAFLVALGFNWFLIPNKIAAGGLSGIATVTFHLFQLPVGIVVLVLNIPLFIAGIIILGRIFGVKTFFSTIILSLIIDSTAFLDPLSSDLLLAALAGGVFTGAGLGIIFHLNASTGGTDIAAKLLHTFVPYFSVGQLLLAIDAAVVISAGLIFKNYDLMLYAAISIFVMSRVIDTILLGVNYTNTIFIISSNPDEIAQQILYNLNRGVTELKGTGKFTGKDRPVLMSVVKSRDVHKVKKIVMDLDESAFVFITSTREVVGEGFTYMASEK